MNFYNKPLGHRASDLPPRESGLPVSKDNFEQVSASQAAPYLPQAKLREIVIRKSGQSQSTLISLCLFQSETFSTEKGQRVLLNAGGSVWGMRWAPLRNRGGRQYLTIGGYKGNSEEHHILGQAQKSKTDVGGGGGDDGGDNEMMGCIQIWGFPQLGDDTNLTMHQPRLDMCILHERGVVFDLKWGPFGWHDDEKVIKDKNTLPRLGFLAVAFGDGSFSVYNIPYPTSLRKHFDVSDQETLYVKVKEPVFTGKMEGTLLWRLAWNSYNQIATGCTNGHICLWNLESDLSGVKSRSVSAQEENEPLLCFPAHDAAISSINWIVFEGGLESYIISSGFDGKVMLHDLQDPYDPTLLVRVRGFCLSFSYSYAMNAILFGDAEQSIRYLKPGEEDPKRPNKTGPTMDGDDEVDQCNLHVIGIAFHKGGSWDVDVSDYSPFMASVGAEGALKLTNMNRLRHRSLKLTQAILYHLKWIDGKLHMIENFPDEVYSSQMTSNPSYDGLIVGEASLQRVRFNPNPGSMAFLASAGAAGTVRVERFFL